MMAGAPESRLQHSQVAGLYVKTSMSFFSRISHKVCLQESGGVENFGTDSEILYHS